MRIIRKVGRYALLPFPFRVTQVRLVVSAYRRIPRLCGHFHVTRISMRFWRSQTFKPVARTSVFEVRGGGAVGLKSRSPWRKRLRDLVLI